MALSRTAKLFAALVLPLVAAACGHSPKVSRVSLSARECMARVMYFESNRSSDDGMLAVGTVVMNRVASGRYPRTVCGVIGQPNQFAPGVLTRPMTDSGKPRAYRMADAVLSGARNPRVGSKSMFFHTAGYKFPYRNMHYVAIAGGNAFYEKRRPAPGVMIASQESIAATERVRMASLEPSRPVYVARHAPTEAAERHAVESHMAERRARETREEIRVAALPPRVAERAPAPRPIRVADARPAYEAAPIEPYRANPRPVSVWREGPEPRPAPRRVIDPGERMALASAAPLPAPREPEALRAPKTIEELIEAGVIPGR
ncbi:hypothetical protein HNR47_000201 [Methylopila jiangsuensis]|uniref:cell wall hydrolase n=1 Tax=Methylopila jiangsuensis TaxID=586230 RepID=UPI0022F340AD|nr:cell wall hydrolase [Methylopila jiangsuensis]MDR6284218.1 hypothetical protein [Methylopila jiangsuensis]